MPYLSFSSQPPTSKTFNGIHNATSGTAEPLTQVRVITDEKLASDCEIAEIIKAPSEPPSQNTYPVVRLEADTITDAAAGRLASSLLGHVLFLKNQIPFPVMQLGRIPGGKMNSRSSKQRAELLASYDTISSHLDTTFSALSTALARCSGASSGQRKLAQAHVAILVGPSMGSAKSKVMLGIDGLETRIWGARDDATPRTKEEEPDESDLEEENDEDEDRNVEESDDSGDVPDDSDDDDDDEEEDEEGDEEDEEGDEEVDEDEVEDEDEVDDEEPVPLPPPPPYISYAEEQKFLHNADRLLSRTLAAADAEGQGITSEMSPTQTHILIRAPRIFSHPAWIPRQNISAGLDSSLQDFLRDSGIRNSDLLEREPRSKSNSKKAKVEGVWVTTRKGVQGTSPGNGNTSESVPQSTGEDDRDMIWWSWDGKFVGFADW